MADTYLRTATPASQRLLRGEPILFTQRCRVRLSSLGQRSRSPKSRVQHILLYQDTVHRFLISGFAVFFVRRTIRQTDRQTNTHTDYQYVIHTP